MGDAIGDRLFRRRRVWQIGEVTARGPADPHRLEVSRRHRVSQGFMQHIV